MMTRPSLALLVPTLLAAALLATAVPAWAQAEEAPANLSAGMAGTAPGPVRSLSLAWDLYASGLRDEDPLLMLTAVRLAHTSSPRAATGWVTDAPLVTDAPPASRLPRDPASPEALALAMLMAEGDPALADLAADVEAGLARSRPARGQLPTYASRLAGGADAGFRIVFNGELPAEVALVTDSPGRLALAVSDDNGHPICAGSGPVDHAFCAFTPMRNGWFTVTVTNPGPDEVLFRLITN